MRRLYRNAQIAAEDAVSLHSADILVDGDRIEGVGEALPRMDGVEEIDATGRVALPGLFDMHVHAREPGQEQKENIASCAAAAINGGITGLVMMPDTTPPIDSGGVVSTVLESAGRTPIGPSIHTAGCVTKGRHGKELAGIAGMQKAGAVFLSDEGACVGNAQVLRRAMEYARDYDLMIASHCEVEELSASGVMHEGSVSYALGLPGIPSISEEIGIARDIRLAEYLGVRLHIQHVSTSRGMETIRRAKERGIQVTCEVAPHHLLFNHADIGDYSTHFKTRPPLRTAEDSEALLQGLNAGVIDVIATDHSPHTAFEVNQDFASAPFGIAGLETALLSLYTSFIAKGRMTWGSLVSRFSATPRRLLGLSPVAIQEGSSADFILFHPDSETRIDDTFLQSKARNSPYLNQTLSGRVEHVCYRGEILLAR